jgi:recombination protein RecA|tara:strand:+ start:32552 stop:33697 length:1146 start_codon:yes stop_codon:yes gene_type:complete
MPRAKKVKAGKLSMEDMRKLINKKAGQNVAHDLTDENPTEVKQWIPTGSRWLDSIVCRGKRAGIPVGKVTEIAGLESTGKSYMAAQIAANAQKMGIDVIYFDSESAIDPNFLQRAGCDLNSLLYVQAVSVEFVLETIEDLLGNNENQMLFIWDSLALTPSISDVEGDFNPQSSMAVKARILAKGMSKLTVPIADTKSTFLVLNQLKTNIPQGPFARIEAMTTPYMTPGGKAMHYAYSLRIWLTGRKAKSSFIEDENGFRIGSEVKAKIEKSRFGTAGRNCNFRIMWSDSVRILDEESWFDAIKGSKHLTSAGAWYTLDMGDSTTKKFQPSKWSDIIMEDKGFRDRVINIMDEEVVLKFKLREGKASDFYDHDSEEQKTQTA